MKHYLFGGLIALALVLVVAAQTSARDLVKGEDYMVQRPCLPNPGADDLRAQMGSQRKTNFSSHAIRRGWQYFHSGDWGTAIKRFHQAVIIAPANPAGYFGKAFVYSHQKRYADAEPCYRRTIELDPDFPHAYANLAMNLIYSGRKAESGPLIAKALELAPKDWSVQYNAAVYYFHMERYAQAWKHLAIAQRLDENGKINPAFVEDLRSRMPGLWLSWE